jgi:3-deoxy-D-manno-octulosonic-acid transferase
MPWSRIVVSTSTEKAFEYLRAKGDPFVDIKTFLPLDLFLPVRDF